MKVQVSHKIGISVSKANVITPTNEDLLWSLDLLSTSHPEQLLNTVIFFVSKGFALHAGKEHWALHGLPFHSQFKFIKDNNGENFYINVEDMVWRPTSGAWSIRKLWQRRWTCMPCRMRTTVPYKPLSNIWHSSLRTEHEMPSIYSHGRNISERCLHLNRLGGLNKLRSAAEGVPCSWPSQSLHEPLSVLHSGYETLLEQCWRADNHGDHWATGLWP